MPAARSRQPSANGSELAVWLARQLDRDTVGILGDVDADAGILQDRPRSTAPSGSPTAGTRTRRGPRTSASWSGCSPSMRPAPALLLRFALLPNPWNRAKRRGVAPSLRSGRVAGHETRSAARVQAAVERLDSRQFALSARGNPNGNRGSPANFSLSTPFTLKGGFAITKSKWPRLVVAGSPRHNRCCLA